MDKKLHPSQSTVSFGVPKKDESKVNIFTTFLNKVMRRDESPSATFKTKNYDNESDEVDESECNVSQWYSDISDTELDENKVLNVA